MALIIFIASPMTAFAMEGDSTSVTPRYTSIFDYSLYLTVSNGNANISATLDGKSGVTESYIKCNLEKLTGSTYWMQIQSFSSTGTSSTSLSTSYGVGSGMYRVMGTFRCDSETVTAYSSNVTY